MAYSTIVQRLKASFSRAISRSDPEGKIELALVGKIARGDAEFDNTARQDRVEAEILRLRDESVVFGAWIDEKLARLLVPQASSLHDPPYRRHLACTTRDEEAGKMPAVRLQDDSTL